MNVLHEPVKNLIWSFVDNSDIWVLVPKQEKKKSTNNVSPINLLLTSEITHAKGASLTLVFDSCLRNYERIWG